MNAADLDREESEGQGFDEPEEASDSPSPGPALTQEQAPADNWEEAKEKLGTRAGFLQLYKGGRRGFVKPLEKHRLPVGFDLEECRKRCTWGAVYGQQRPGSTPQLYCTNEKHYKEKVAQAKTARVEAVKEKVQKEAEEDRASVQALLSADQSTLFRNVVLALMAEQSYHKAQMPGGWAERELWYERGTTTRVREMLGIDNPKPEQGGLNSTVARFDRDYALVAKVKAMELSDLQELAANLMVYTFRERQYDDED